MRRLVATAIKTHSLRPAVMAIQRLPRSFSTAPDPGFHNNMFCRQCEQTANHYACTTQGICGKTSETAACQDAL